MRRFKFASLVAFFAAMLLAVGMQFAYAHHPILSGTPSCPGPDHVIDWSIGNSQPKQTIVSFATITATMGGVTYPVTGYTLPVATLGDTSASSTIPGPLTGTVTLAVRAVWSDGHKALRTVDVDLPDPCPTTVTTTPTTIPTTTPTTTKVKVPGPTTVPTTPSSMTGDSSTPTTVCVATPSPTDASGSTLAPGTCGLAYTGGNMDLAAVAVTLGGLGVVLLMAAGIGLKRRYQP